MNFHSLLAANALNTKMLGFLIEAQKGDVVVLDFLLYASGETATIYWGDGTSITSTGEVLAHEYTSAGSFNLYIQADNGMSRLVMSNSTANIIGGNEKWFYHPNLQTIVFAYTNSALEFQLLPESTKKMDFACTDARYALLPIKRIPKGVTTMRGAFYNCDRALLPFENLPDNVSDSTNAFSGCRNAITTITKLPSALVEGGGTFYRCENMKIKINRFPAGIASLHQTFDQSSAEINLDEIVANAPDGGFTALTDIGGAFYLAPGVTGSRSRFLAVCPNVQNTENAFNGTNTTE